MILQFADPIHAVVLQINGDGTVASFEAMLLDQATLATVQPYVPPTIPLKLQAQVALSDSDITMLRCVEAAVAVPAAWDAYRKALRAIANGTDTTSTALPVKPPYPAGT